MSASTPKSTEPASPSSPVSAKERIGKENAEKLKVMGNEYFKRGRFSAAIEAYTEAINLFPEESVFYTNRALCYHKRREWSRVASDCQAAVNLNPKTVKGYYLLGVAETELGNFDKGDQLLGKALALTSSTDTYRKMVEQALRLVKKRKWEKEREKTDKKDQDLRQFICELMEGRLEQQLSVMSPEEEEARQSLRTQYEARVAELDAIFEERRSPQVAEIPDYLCCKITFEPFLDPVITSAGHTYERNALEQHMSKVGMFDPTTRTPLMQNSKTLVPNIAIRDATRAFLDNNPSLWQDALG